MLFVCIQSYYILTENSGDGVINWGAPGSGSQLTWFILHRLVVFALAAIYVMFVVNIMKYIKTGSIFNKRNITLFRIMAVMVPVYSFLDDNIYSLVLGSDVGLMLSERPFASLFIILLVGQLYKVGYEAAEEQKLTI